MSIGYPDLVKMSWPDVIEATNGEAKMPLSVHIPLNMPCSQKLVYCDCAMNAYVLDVPLGMNTSIVGDYLVRMLQRVKLLSFAFGEPAFVPDFRQVKMSRKIGGLPIIRADFSAWHIIYTTDYCVAPNGNLHVRMTVKNENPEKRKVDIRLRPSNPLESEVFDYHYVSFRWDASKWPKDNSYDFYENDLFDKDGKAGVLQPGNFSVKWEKANDFSGQNFASNFRCSLPYTVQPDCRLGKITNTIHLNTELEYGESQSFEMTLKTASLGDAELSEYASYADAEAASVKFWNARLEGYAQIDTGLSKENDVIDAIRLNSLQLLIDDGKSLQPCQGGSSERFYVWVWEAMCCIRPMIKLGYFKEARKVIDFVFSLQDGGCPPQGKFTSVKGAIGTSGPKWANATGAALIMASDYLEFSKDESFVSEYMDKMLAAGRWITGELKATRVEGSSTYGIMPPACANDGDYGQFAFTDSWLLGGLERLRDALASINHPAFEEFDAEAKQYKQDLDAALDRNTAPDGFIVRYMGECAKISNAFRFTDTPLDCCAAGVSRGTEPRMARFLEWLEKNAFVGFFCSEISHGIYYIGNNELTVMGMYLEQGQWKKAWAAARVFRRFTTTPDVYLTQERYSENDTGFTAWQPNASNNGRFIVMQLSRILYEIPGKIILYGGYNPFELERKPGVKNLHTAYGLTSVSIDKGKVTVKTEKPIKAGVTIVTPWTSFVLDEDKTEIVF